MDERAKKILAGLKSKYFVIPGLGALVLAFVLTGAYRKLGSEITNQVVLYLIGGQKQSVGIEIVQGARAAEQDLAQAPQPEAGAHDQTFNREIPNAEHDKVLSHAQTDAVLLAMKQESPQQAALSEGSTQGTDTSSTNQSHMLSSQPYQGLKQVERTAVRHVQAYTASYLRDPFYSLVKAEAEKPSKLLDVSKAKMVGAVWGESGIIALLEDDKGRSYALREGDRVLNGRVSKVTPSSVTFVLTIFGITRQVTLEIAEEGEW